MTGWHIDVHVHKNQTAGWAVLVGSAGRGGTGSVRRSRRRSASVTSTKCGTNAAVTLIFPSCVFCYEQKKAEKPTEPDYLTIRLALMCLRYPSKSAADTPDGSISHLAPSPDVSFQEKMIAGCKNNLPACCSQRFGSDLFSLLPCNRTLPAPRGEGVGCVAQRTAGSSNCARSRSGVLQFTTTASLATQNQTRADNMWACWSTCFYDCCHHGGAAQRLRPSLLVFSIQAPAVCHIGRVFTPVFHGHPPSSWPRFKTWLISSRLSLSCVPLLHKDHTDVVLQGEIHL